MIAAIETGTDAMHTSKAVEDSVATLRGATKRYGSTTALADADFDVKAGKIVALLGPNGAGKTTAVRLLLGLESANAGEARVFGRDPRLHANRARTGVMLQVGRVPDTLRVGEFLEMFSGYYPTPLSRERVVAAAGLTGLARRRFGVLSGGQKQRVLFALAICGDPDLLVLDEPTLGLDVEARHTLWDVIRDFAERGKSVLLTTHYLEEADALADRIVVLSKGRVIADGSPAEIKLRTAGRVIRCTTSIAVEDASRIPGVIEARRERSTLELHVQRAEPVVRALLDADPELADLEVSGAGLERAFLALTRDAADTEVTR